MRLANAADEIEPLQDPRVQSNSSYLTIILLSRVITELGDLETVNKHTIENLFVKDLEYLQSLYARINRQGTNTVDTACPECGTEFEVDAGTGAAVSDGDEPPGQLASDVANIPTTEGGPGNTQ